MARGFAGYISKPIEAETFVSQVEAYLPPDRRGRAAPRRMSAILVLDDRAADRELLATLLEHAGYNVSEAATGGEALEFMRVSGRTWSSRTS